VTFLSLCLRLRLRADSKWLIEKLLLIALAQKDVQFMI
jgi:hypothetical protein